MLINAFDNSLKEVSGCLNGIKNQWLASEIMVASIDFQALFKFWGYSTISGYNEKGDKASTPV